MNRIFLLLIFLNPIFVTGQEIEISDKSDGPVRDFCISHDQDHVLIVYDSKIVLRNIRKNIKVEELTHPLLRDLKKIAPLPSGNSYLIATKNILIQYHLSTKTAVKILDLDSVPSLIKAISENEIAIGDLNKSFIVYDLRKDEILFTYSANDVITGILFDNSNSTFTISELNGNLYQIDLLGNGQKVFDLENACFDLSYSNEKKMIVAGTSNDIYTLVRKKDKLDYLDKEKNNGWVTCISNKMNSLAFGSGSGNLVINTSFSKYRYHFNSSLKKIELLNNSNSVIEITVLTEMDKLYFLGAIQMKHK